MKKEDDFFRITFRREEDVIKSFEQNMDQLAGGGISRPLLVATICNYFFEQGYGVMWKNGAWEIVEPRKDNPQERSINNRSKQQTLEVAPINRSADTVVTTSHLSETTEDIKSSTKECEKAWQLIRQSISQRRHMELSETA